MNFWGDRTNKKGSTASEEYYRTDVAAPHDPTIAISPEKGKRGKSERRKTSVEPADGKKKPT